MFQLLQGGVAESYHLLKAYRDFCFWGFEKIIHPSASAALNNDRSLSRLLLISREY